MVEPQIEPEPDPEPEPEPQPKPEPELTGEPETDPVEEGPVPGAMQSPKPAKRAPTRRASLEIP
jgi:hypothetical protein